MYLYVSIYIYILKKNGTFSRSFLFFINEQDGLYVLSRSFEKNGKERSVLLGLISRQKLKKTEKNGTFFKRSKRPEPSERERTRCPTLAQSHILALSSIAQSHILALLSIAWSHISALLWIAWSHMSALSSIAEVSTLSFPV